MTQKTIKISIDDFFSKSPEKNYPTVKTDVYHIDDIWSLDIVNLNDYGPKSLRGFKYVSVVIDTFSKFGWTVSLKNKVAQTITNSFQNFHITSRRKPLFYETDRGKEFYN